MKLSLVSRVLLVVGVLIGTGADDVQADVRLPGFFADHMVIQQQKPIRIWGWDNAGQRVTVSIGESSVIATADDSGRWSAELPAMTASDQPTTVAVEGSSTIEIKDVLVGEVWLCSGQSNMEWTVASSTNAKEEIAAAEYPTIRQFQVGKRPSNVPMDDVQSNWQLCSPQTAGGFTACGYFMARKLQKELGVPIGLLNSSWGGTRIEPWTAPVGFEKVDALADIYDSVLSRTPGTDRNRDLNQQHVTNTQAWIDAAKQALATGGAVSPSPAYPATLTPFESHQDPTMLYNGMIHAMVGFPIRGAIWYQGESNHGEGMLYTEKMKALIAGWRELWKQGDFPFYFVQIAPFQYGAEDPEVLATFWEAQAAATKIPNTGMVVINDIATIGNIHPPNKQDVGLRLALLALKHDYGRDVVAESPTMASMESLNGSLKITFENTGGGLKTRDGGPATHFEVIGVGSNGFQPAQVTIEGDTVALSSPKCQHPVAFRFAWDKLAEPNLVGGTGLPVGAFRGGKVPSFVDQLPIDDDFRLVYDVDLAKLGKTISYTTDQSETAGTFSKIGYLLELQSGGGAPQGIFVVVDAFTDDAKKIGIPTAASKAMFQQSLSSVDVYSNVAGIVTGTNIKTGNIEFWPNNYGPGNDANVKGASGTKYDFGDVASQPVDGYGSMQIHNFDAKQTLFSINHWSSGASADIGIGNNSGDNTDWTFSGNAASYSEKRLRVFVK
ncbi:MAG: sialate O-acetylesterase [Rubripirellula sp.]